MPTAVNIQFYKCRLVKDFDPSSINEALLKGVVMHVWDWMYEPDKKALWHVGASR